MYLTIIGEGAGLAVALLMTRFLSSLLFGVAPTDPITFTAVGIVVMATAFIACYIPARRATSVDPTIAIRNE
jgi:ABC-type antimicrobial peptide transport system permease subunit